MVTIFETSPRARSFKELVYHVEGNAVIKIKLNVPESKCRNTNGILFCTVALKRDYLRIFSANK